MDQYEGKTYEVRHFFDKSEQLLDYCTRLLSFETMKKNNEYDNALYSQKAVAAYIKKCVNENVDGIESVITKSLGVNKNEGFYIWGSGDLGLSLARYLRERGVLIKGIIDNYSCDTDIDGFEINRYDAIEKGVAIFVAVADTKSNESILKQIAESGNRSAVIRFQDMYEEDI